MEEFLHFTEHIVVCDDLSSVSASAVRGQHSIAGEKPTLYKFNRIILHSKEENAMKRKFLCHVDSSALARLHAVLDGRLSGLLRPRGTQVNRAG